MKTYWGGGRAPHALPLEKSSWHPLGVKLGGPRSGLDVAVTKRKLSNYAEIQAKARFQVLMAVTMKVTFI